MDDGVWIRVVSCCVEQREKLKNRFDCESSLQRHNGGTNANGQALLTLGYLTTASAISSLQSITNCKSSSQTL